MKSPYSLSFFVKIFIIQIMALYWQTIKASNEIINGTLTPIESSIQGAISNRHQEHMWVTDDGGVHLLIAGSTDSESGLHIFSTYDSGLSWSPTFDIEDTEYRPKADALFQDGKLHLLYLNSEKALIYERATQTNNKSWMRKEYKILIDANQSFIADRATLALDSKKRLWVAMTQIIKRENTSVIRVGRVENDGYFRILDESFGTLNNLERKSARILASNGGMFVVYTDSPDPEGSYHTLNFSYFPSTENMNDRDDLNILTYDPKDTAKDQYGTHFNALVDGRDYLHIVTVNRDKIFYFRWSSKNPAELLKNTLGSSNPYVQITNADDECLYVAGTERETPYNKVINLMRSNNGGEAFFMDRYYVYETEWNSGKSIVEMPLKLSSDICSTNLLPLIREIDLPTGFYGFVFF